MCVHCLVLQQIPRPEKKMSRQNAAAINLSFPTPGKGKLFHIWGKITDFDWEKEVGFSFYNRELNKTGGNSR